MEFLNGLEKSVYEQIKLEFGEEVALNVLWNWEEYSEQSEQYHHHNEQDIELLKVYNILKTNNMNALKEIHVNGEYFNNKASSYYSSKDGYLVFEDETSKQSYKTNILYKDFKLFTEAHLVEVSEVLIYVNTQDNDLVERLTKMNNMNELMYL